MKSQGFASEFLHASQRFGFAIGEIIHRHHVIAGMQRFQTRMAADISRATGH